jgi:hypothetical protein
MENAIVTSRSGGLQSAESNALLSLRDALRERLAIIQDQESRRDVNTHLSRLRESRRRATSCERRFRSQSIHSWHTIYGAKATIRRWNSWKTCSGVCVKRRSARLRFTRQLGPLRIGKLNNARLDYRASHIPQTRSAWSS